MLEDSWAVGVVVRDRHEQPVASISMAAIKSRLGTARGAILGNRLMQASSGIGGTVETNSRADPD